MHSLLDQQNETTFSEDSIEWHHQQMKYAPKNMLAGNVSFFFFHFILFFKMFQNILLPNSDINKVVLSNKLTNIGQHKA